MTIIAWDRTDFDRSRYENAKSELINYMGGECAHCGATDSLEFDHIDPATKRYAILSRWNRGLAFLIPELLKCQLLCSDCHSAKTLTQVSVGHGGGESGKRNCKCDACREQKNAYMRKWKSVHRAA